MSKKKNKQKKYESNKSIKKQQKKIKKMNKYKSRRDMLIDSFPKADIKLMFGDNKKAIEKFGNYLVEIEDYFINDDINSILFDGMSTYEERIEKICKKGADDINDLIFKLHKINSIRKKMKKNDYYSYKRKSRDLSIASYLNDKKYKKKFLDKDKYRKHMKKIAKAEKKEIDEMKKMGYIVNNNPDKKLKSLKLNKVNEAMLNALSDAYTQKHFL